MRPVTYKIKHAFENDGIAIKNICMQRDKNLDLFTSNKGY